MRRPTILLVLLPVMLMAATRVMDVAPYRNCNGWSEQNQYIAQTFVNTVDSVYLWAEFFVGAGNAAGHYDLEVWDGGTKMYSGETDAGPSISYDYLRAELSPEGPEPPIKGKTYKLVITHSDGDSINYYADSTDPYKYGSIGIPGDANKNKYDLACRIEGINRPVGQDAFAPNRH